MTPELQLMMDVQSAAKTQQASIGVAAYKKAIAEGTRINPDLYSNLLYLCAGCDDWELALRQQLIEATPLTQDIMHMAASSDASETPELTDAPQEASKGAVPSPQSGAASPPSQCNNTDIQAAKTGGEDQEAATAVVCAEAIATTPVSADTTASNSASQSGRGTSAADGDQMASTSGRDVPSMSAAELHAAGRSIFAHMQVHTYSCRSMLQDSADVSDCACLHVCSGQGAVLCRVTLRIALSPSHIATWLSSRARK